jgi:hypothetical protein
MRLDSLSGGTFVFLEPEQGMEILGHIWDFSSPPVSGSKAQPKETMLSHLDLSSREPEFRHLLSLRFGRRYHSWPARIYGKENLVLFLPLDPLSFLLLKSPLETSLGGRWKWVVWEGKSFLARMIISAVTTTFRGRLRQYIQCFMWLNLRCRHTKD